MKTAAGQLGPVTLAGFRQHLKSAMELGEPLLVARRGKELLGIFIPL